MKINSIVEKNNLKYFVQTYGCQMNDHESEKICGMLENLGYISANSKEDADLIVFNTCCIRDNAEQKLIGHVGALKTLKQQKQELIIAICGCMTQQKEVSKKLYRTFPFIDIILGTHNLVELPSRVNECLQEKKRVHSILDSSGGIVEEIPISRKSWPLARVNIMYGCNNFCSYCIVPYVRGRERSRTEDAILDEISRLVADGYREVMLLGQNVNSFQGDSGTGFPELLQKICNETSLERIRFMTSHPKDLSPALIETMRNNPQICKHVHLPVQSGSSSILEKMNRGYTREQYVYLVQQLRDVIPDIIITSDIIVGFPGETKQDFEDTLSLLKEIQFDSAFTFVYSRRTGTKAAEMTDVISPKIQQDRIMQLVDLQNSITEEKNRAFEGTTQSVLIEGISSRNENDVCGRTDGGKMINLAGDPSLIGQMIQVKVTQAKRTTLYGEQI